MLGLLMMSVPLGIAVGLSTVALVWAEPDGSAFRNSPTRVFVGTDWEQACVPKCQLEIIRTSKLHHQVKP